MNDWHPNPNEIKKGFFIGKYGQNLLLAPVRWAVTFYIMTGLAYVFTGTDRYMMTRPGDVFLLYYATGFMFIKQLLLFILWMVGLFSLKVFLILALILFLSPPFITMVILEFLLWKHPE